MVEEINETLPRRVGRPTKFKDEYIEWAFKLSLLGATDEEIADFFEIATSTLYLWKLEVPEFSEALRAGKRKADAEIASSLFNRARGAEWTEQQAFKIKVGPHEERIEVVDIKKAAPPDTQAASLWLRNRDPERWREKVTAELTGPNGGPIQTKELSDTELNARIDELSAKVR